MTDTPHWTYIIREDDADWEGHITAPTAQAALDQAFAQASGEITQPEDITLEARCEDGDCPDPRAHESRRVHPCPPEDKPMTYAPPDPGQDYDREGVIDLMGTLYMKDASGRLVPLSVVKPEDQLQDQTIRKIIGYAEELSARIARFRGHTFDDIATTLDLMAEKYGVRRGGAKGNVTLTSYDGLLKVTVQVQEQLTFGPELQIAKNLVDQCIGSWAEGVNDKIRALVEHAFQVDKEGRINRAALFQLRRLSIDDADWKAAMEALGDAIRVIGSKEYVRFYRRTDTRSRWQPITIDLAAV